MYDPIIVDIWGMVRGRDPILYFLHMDNTLPYHNWGGNTTEKFLFGFITFLTV